MIGVIIFPRPLLTVVFSPSPPTDCQRGRNIRVHKMSRIGGPNAIREDQKEHKGTKGCLNNGKEQDQSKEAEKVNGGKEHHECTDQSGKSRRQNRWTQVEQSMLGSGMTIRVAG